MSTTLQPMREASYPAYLEAAVVSYAQENIDAGRWTEDTALERSREDFNSLLPQGLATPDNHIFDILAGEGGATVGVIWLAIGRKHGIVSSFVYDVEIQPQHRRQGHAERAFKAIETFAQSLGAAHIGLHVFGNNPGAQALYQKLGFGVTGINMQKPLAAASGPGA